MNRIRFREGVIDAMKREHNFESDAQAAAALGVTADQLERLRHGAPISADMALQFAAVQGTGYRIDLWIEPVPAFDLATT
ncbi:MAG: hypothetical protein QM809_11335 [Gordonia sp. (in: high G+C Gram-positive bacteria)]|uniref:hypothetical protein n=1 Tax=Gordonia sp. (in: high G+C Gram-positive bacteria) TaxID=84139 RepID=UPI0039E53AA1